MRLVDGVDGYPWLLEHLLCQKAQNRIQRKQNINENRKIQNSADCFGGVARVHQRQKEIREEDPEAIFLNAGDFYQVSRFDLIRVCVFILNVSKTQGTAWYTKLKYGPMVEFGNLLNYTAMGVGNHDFDDSVEGFVPFAEQVVTCICIW